MNLFRICLMIIFALIQPLRSEGIYSSYLAPKNQLETLDKNRLTLELKSFLKPFKIDLEVDFDIDPIFLETALIVLKLLPQAVLQSPAFQELTLGGGIPGFYNSDAIGLYHNQCVTISDQALDFLDPDLFISILLHEIGHSVDAGFLNDHSLQRQLKTAFVVIKANNAFFEGKAGKYGVDRKYFIERSLEEYLAEFFKYYIYDAKELKIFIQQQNAKVKEALMTIFTIFSQVVFRHRSYEEQEIEPLLIQKERIVSRGFQVAQQPPRCYPPDPRHYETFLVLSRFVDSFQKGRQALKKNDLESALSMFKKAFQIPKQFLSRHCIFTYPTRVEQYVAVFERIMVSDLRKWLIENGKIKKSSETDFFQELSTERLLSSMIQEYLKEMLTFYLVGGRTRIDRLSKEVLRFSLST